MTASSVSDPSSWRACLRFLACLALGLGLTAQATTADDDARRAFDRGAFAEAAASWEQAVAAHHAAGHPEAALRSTLSLSKTLQFLGQHPRAVTLLESALGQTSEAPLASYAPLVQARLGAALILTRRWDRAESLLQQALASARQQGPPHLIPEILNDQGNLHTLRRQFPAALTCFTEAVDLARLQGNVALVAQALANAAAATVQAGDPAQAQALNAQALDALDALPPSHAQAFLFLTAGTTDRDLHLAAGDTPDPRLLRRAHHSFSRALTLAGDLQNLPIRAQALGALAHLYELDGQRDHALTLARQTVFASQQAALTESLYQAEWLTGRLLQTQGDTEAALAAYRRAVQSLQPIRHDVSLGYGNRPAQVPFRDAEGRLFVQLADLLLRQARVTPDPSHAQLLLREARETIELLKAVELEDYFQDECVNIQRAKARPLESIDDHTAIVYLVPLPDRTEVLLALGSRIEQLIQPLPADALASHIRDFRRNLENRTSHAYLIQARQLYDWLIRPLLPLLQANAIDTLVMVPDGPLRTIPLAALHDGERFLIHEFAVAVAPGLSLIEPQPIERERARLLLSGLTEAVQGFPPLYFVADELDALGQLYRGETLANEQFTASQIRHQMTSRQFSIVHIASHGKFDSDVRNTFLLTYDGKLTLNDLESLIRPNQYRGRPVELLVLSACQTAAGDDRAALGLAGVAVKAGARSALATLWFVNDQSTSALVSELYGQFLLAPAPSKARALQAAQLSLLNDRRFRHPCYWSPYLILGNWL